MNAALASMMAKARGTRYEPVEVFSNLNAIADRLLETFIRHNIKIATSFYSARKSVHDTITKVNGSHRRRWKT